MSIRWYPALTIGVGEIDEQHQELFRRVGALTDALMQRRGAEELKPLFTFLADYVIEHFGAEESIMRLRRFPGRAAHEAEHRRFVEDFGALHDEWARDGATALLLVKLNNRVTQWLVTHISRTDRELGAFLRESAVAT